MEKKNVKKEVINNEVKTQNTTSQVKEVKKTPVTKIKAKVVKTTKKAKKETPKETPETTKAKVTKEVEAQQKANLIEGVVAHREIKYIYPEDVTDTLARKNGDNRLGTNLRIWKGLISGFKMKTPRNPGKQKGPRRIPIKSIKTRCSNCIIQSYPGRGSN